MESHDNGTRVRSVTAALQKWSETPAANERPYVRSMLMSGTVSQNERGSGWQVVERMRYNQQRRRMVDGRATVTQWSEGWRYTRCV